MAKKIGWIVTGIAALGLIVASCAEAPKPPTPPVEVEVPVPEKKVPQLPIERERHERKITPRPKKAPPSIPDHRLVCDEILNAAVRVVPGKKGWGSGFIVSPKGAVVTNAHVAKHSRTGRLTIIDRHGNKYQAKVVKMDRREDLALARIQNLGNKRLPYLKVSRTPMEKGQQVCLLGYSKGRLLPVPLTYLGEVRSKWEGYLTRGICPGDSGGPIINKDGEVVGVGSARHKQKRNTLCVPLRDLRRFLYGN